MKELKVVKKQLLLDLDKNEAPAAWRWRVDRFVQFDDGRETIVADEIPASAEEVARHIGAAVGRQKADIDNDRREHDAAIAERDDKLAEADATIEKLTEQAAGLTARLEAVARLDAQYDAAAKPLLAREEART